MSTPFVHAVTVSDPIGLHARPIGQIVSLLREKGATVLVRTRSGGEASASSALRLLSLKVKTGETLQLVIESPGSEEPEALALALERLINQG